jgi:integrase
MREELVSRNVARLVELEKEQRGDITPWTAQETAHFLRHVESHPLYPAFLMLAVYGIRRGEVLGLRWQDIDWQQGAIHIRQQLQQVGNHLEIGPVKTNAGKRDLPLLPVVRAALDKYRSQRGRRYTEIIEGVPVEVEILDGRDASLRQSATVGNRRLTDTECAEIVMQGRNNAPLWPRNFARTFHKLAKEAGLRRIKLHWLRHGAATLLKNYGVPDRDAQLIFGHAHISTTQQIYQHGDSEIQRTGLARVGRALLVTDNDMRSRQIQPSNVKNVARDTTIIEPKKKVDLSSSRLLSLEGPLGLEPRTPCLKALTRLGRDPSLTSIFGHVKTQMRTNVLGSVAVSLAVKNGDRFEALNVVMWEWISLRTALAPIPIPYINSHP